MVEDRQDWLWLRYHCRLKHKNLKLIIEGRPSVLNSLGHNTTLHFFLYIPGRRKTSVYIAMATFERCKSNFQKNKIPKNLDGTGQKSTNKGLNTSFFDMLNLLPSVSVVSSS